MTVTATSSVRTSQAEESLRAVLRRLAPVVVAFSGGADSALLAWMANGELGRSRALCATAVSPSLAPEEEADCRSIAAEWGLRWTAVETDEMGSDAYRANGPDRCYHCKDALMDALVPLARRESATVVLGVNVDDLSDYRPGQRAARERGASFPLVEAGMTKDDVRALSRAHGLRTAAKPAAPCLASRLPYGTPVTVGVLSSVARAESALRALGFAGLRVRHYGNVARIELPEDRLAEAVALRSEIIAGVRGAGYRYVTLDLEGMRSGNLNREAGL
ncbi:MAG: ATP-dependent sacrificial sulfur transferase LarE [Actinomycetota bacterium]|nr:ATP-dependent sacrificial sulfur transferase LarE [Actinomycetota bacterium]